MKYKLTLSIDRNLVELARIENVNISALLEEYLTKYLEANSTEEIDKKIGRLNENIKALKDRKEELLRMGINATKTQGLMDEIWRELTYYYKERLKQGLVTKQDNLSWLSSPMNLRRCKIIGLEPLYVLQELQKRVINQQTQHLNQSSLPI